MSSSSLPTTTLKLPGLGRPGGKVFWEEYLKKVTDEDIRLINRWQKILDTLLVYVGLFIGVLTAFIIQVSNMLQPSPEDATNRILIAIYNHNMNASSSIDLQQYLTLDATLNSFVAARIPLLYISLAISITEAALALIINVWLSRYQRSLTKAGPTIHERITQRHESYTGLMEWRLPSLIESLPMVALVPLALFAFFISDLIRDVFPTTSATLANIFIITSGFFVLTAATAAFLPGAPFHSPLSSFIRLTFGIFPNRTICGVIRVHTICVSLICGVLAAFVITFNLQYVIRSLVLLLIPVLLLSLCQRTPAGEKAQKHPKPRLFSQATWLYSHSIVIISLIFGMVFLRPISINWSIAFFGLSCILMAVSIIVAMHWRPEDGKAEAEAVAWTIKTQPSHGLLAFQNAVEIARNFAHLRSSLLEDILPVLDALIQSIQGAREQDLKDEEKIYVTLLAVLVNFEPSKASFWRNEAAVKRPVLSDKLEEKLRILCNGGCAVHSSAPHSGCTKAEAEFILGKAGREDCVEKESEAAGRC